MKKTNGTFQQGEGTLQAFEPVCGTSDGASTRGAGAQQAAQDPLASAPDSVLWIDRFLAKRQAIAGSALVAPVPPVAPAAPASLTPPTPLPIRLRLQSVPAAARSQAAPTPLTSGPPLDQFMALPEPIVASLSHLGPDTPVTDALLRSLWTHLEHTTRALAETWDFARSEGSFARGALDGPSTLAGATVLARFPDILPPAATALPNPARSLEHGAARFLHANHVELGCGRAMIAAQKPVTGEVHGFQKMLVEQNVGLIVDLTRFTEREHDCAYVPERQGGILGGMGRQLQVVCTLRERLDDVRASRQSLSIVSGTGAHSIERLRFPDWPDHGVIAIDTLISLANRVDSLGSPTPQPIVVHCLAGVGRTGTFMSFIAARRRIAQAVASGMTPGPEAILRLIVEVVARGRIARGPSFVQTEEQFYLLARALLQVAAAPAGMSLLHSASPKTPAAGVKCAALVSIAPTQSVWQRIRRYFSQA